MQLYIHPFSSNARRARLVASHLGLEIEQKMVDLSKGEQRAPAYLALNPNGKVPTLVDGDTKLWESYAIMIYMCEKSGKRELYPDNLAARTDINKWLFWCANEWSPACGRFNYENMLKAMFGAGQPDPARVAELEEGFKKQAAVLDGHLANHEWLSGKALSLADYAVAGGMMHAAGAKYPLSSYANINKWFARVEQLPAWQATNQG